jgi:SAM-dependent methyltransferase
MVPSSVVRRVEPWVVTAVLVGALVAALGQGRYVVGAQSAGTGEALRECESALGKRTFDEATAAGLNPGAMPVTFEARKATTTKRNGKLIATGTESYRPTPYTDAFDVAYSSLAFHYLTSWPALIARVHRALVNGGRLVFSVEHPIVTASHHPEWIDRESGTRVWPVDHFGDEGARSTNWLVQGVLKQHRTTGTYLNTLIAAGFTIAHVEDWMPTAEQVAARPDWVGERDRPLFMLVAADR